MRKEADGTVAGQPILAQLGAVARGVQPALKHAVGIGAGIPSYAEALLVVGAGRGAVLVLTGVTAPRIFSGVRKGALPPVMGIALGAPQHLCVCTCACGGGEGKRVYGSVVALVEHLFVCVCGGGGAVCRPPRQAQSLPVPPAMRTTYLEAQHPEIVRRVLRPSQLLG